MNRQQYIEERFEDFTPGHAKHEPLNKPERITLDKALSEDLVSAKEYCDALQGGYTHLVRDIDNNTGEFQGPGKKAIKLY